MRYRNRWRLAGVAVLAGSLAAIPGCVAAAVGAGAGIGTYAYATGALSATLDGTVERVAAATKAAFEELKLAEANVKSDALLGEGKAKFADGTSVKVDIKRISDKTTEIRIRVGTFGDKALSVQVYDAIKKHV